MFLQQMLLEISQLQHKSQLMTLRHRLHQLFNVANKWNAIIGTAEVSSTIPVEKVQRPGLDTTVTDAMAIYAVDLIPALTNGEVVNVTATDAAGNESTATQVTTYRHYVPPTAPIAEIVNN